MGTKRVARTAALVALCLAASQAATAAGGGGRARLDFRQATVDQVGRDWIVSHFSDGRVGVDVDNGYFVATDVAPDGDRLTAVVASGASYCSGDSEGQSCPIVVMRQPAGRPARVAYSGMVCADPAEIDASADHRELRTCSVTHALR